VRVGRPWRGSDDRTTATAAIATAPAIAQDYPALQAADIYAVIAYYLRHQDEVVAYLERRTQQAAATRREFQELFPSVGLRERLQDRLR